VEVDVEDREHEAQVARDRRLAGEQGLDPLLDADVSVVDVVVERDHFIRELVVALLERVERSAQRAQDERALLLERRLEQVELVLEGRPHPNRPVT
jgi:hypothetical protein